MPWDIIILHKCTSDDVQFLRYGPQQMDRWKKWHIEVGAPPKKQTSKYVAETTFKTIKIGFELFLGLCFVDSKKVS